MMSSEEMVKVQAHAVSATINFVKGLSDEGEDDNEDEIQNSSKILLEYTADLFNTLATLLQKSID